MAAEFAALHESAFDASRKSRDVRVASAVGTITDIFLLRVPQELQGTGVRFATTELIQSFGEQCAV